ncbi:MAG: type III-A CRISPR-associated protein Csm2 [Methylococcaceae bacterium]|nr:MAG: type III-A CRISPR-associated protein Csm2 [Methylococcaceae bacterium]
MAEFRHAQRHHDTPQRQDESPAISLIPNIRLTKPLNPELFNRIAHDAAKAVAYRDDGKPRVENKSTQLRRFYDEILLWESRSTQQPDKFDEFLPFIRMINAKVAYAKGRRLVDQTFADLMQHSLSEVTNAATLTTCKLFWEAFMGFYKLEHPE